MESTEIYPFASSFLQSGRGIPKSVDTNTSNLIAEEAGFCGGGLGVVVVIILIRVECYCLCIVP